MKIKMVIVKLESNHETSVHFMIAIFVYMY